MSGQGPIGGALPRHDGIPRLTGAARFTADLKRPGALVGKLKRSEHPHARIRAVHTHKARSMPGVHAVLTGDDLPQAYGILPASQDEHALAVDKVRFVGDPIAAVAAVDEAAALAALAAITVEYEVLPPVLDIPTALKDEVLIHEGRKSNVLREVAQDYGDVDRAFGEADLVLERVYYYGPSTHVPLEPHAALAEWGDDHRLHLRSSTQVPHYLHRILAQVLGVPMADIRVEKPYVGAAYGGKSEVFSLEICAAALARAAGRPVAMQYNREEVFYAHRGRHGVMLKLKSAHKSDGTLTGLELNAFLNTGAYASFGVVTTWYIGAFGALPYRLPNYRWRAANLYTNAPPAGPKRGHGALQPRFAIEAHLDEAAERLKLCPIEMRLKQLVEPGEAVHGGLEVTSSALRGCIEAVAEASGWRSRRRALPPGRGLGFACSTYMSGAAHAIYKTDAPHSTVAVSLGEDGRCTVRCGTAEIGQGSTTILAAVVAEVLGLDVETITVIEGDTDLTPVDLGAYSSRVTFMCGNAAKDAAEAIRARLEACRSPSSPLALTDAIVIAAAIEAGGPLTAEGSYTPPRRGGTFGGQAAGPSPAYSFTAQVAEVTVDRETGEVTVERVWAAHDCGRALNRTGVLGQIEGCVYMGHGEALLEAMPTRKHSGLLMNPSILEYRIPTILDTPTIEAQVVESDDPGGPFGAKEAGEGPQLPTVPAIFNAVADAVGERFCRVPLTPDELLRRLSGRRDDVNWPDIPRPEADERIRRRAALLARRRARNQGDEA